MKKFYLISLLTCFAFLFSKAQFTTCNAQFTVSYSGNTVTTMPATSPVDSLTQHFWNFGDGFTSTAMVATHTYNQCGTYMISHGVSGYDSSMSPCGDSVIMAINISCGNSCNIVAAFNSHLDSLQPLIVAFTNSSLVNANVPNTFYWSFGDGQTVVTGDLTSVSHAYSTIGTYAVCLIATSSSGCSDTTCMTVVVQDAPPTPCSMNAAFVADTLGASRVVAFYDQSTSTTQISSYLWSFGDGSSSNLSNPTHQYPAPGTYQACLTIQGDSIQGAPLCTSTSCQTIVIAADTTVICNTPAAYNWIEDTSHNGVVYFYNVSSSTDTTSLVSWNFGDGTSGTGWGISHTYATSGTYTVCMTFTSPNGCVRDTCHTIVVNVNNPAPCNLVPMFEVLLAPNTNSSFAFNNTSLFCDPSATITWSFGDSTFDTGNTISHSFAQSGSYWVCMHVAMSNTCFGDTCINVVVNNPTPCNISASFIATPSTTQSNSFTFTSLTANPSAQINWLISDSTFLTGQSVQHSFANPGIYSVCSSVSLDNCIADTCINIVVDSFNITPIPASPMVTYPNPAHNQLHVVLPVAQPQVVVATIYNMQNIVMSQQTIPANGNQSLTINISNLIPGMYILKLNYNGQVNATLFQKM